MRDRMIKYKPQVLRWSVVNPDGSIAQAGEQHNLLLSGYKDLALTYGFSGGGTAPSGLATYAVVGTGSSDPVPTQTTLDAEVARTANSPGGDAYILSGPNTFDLRYIREFPAGTFNGVQLREWGFSPSGGLNNPLMSRELFRDPTGTPVVVTVGSSQSLRFEYVVRLQLAPATPVAASVTLSGIGTLTGKAFLQHRENSSPATFNILALPEMMVLGKTSGTYYYAGQSSSGTFVLAVHLWDRDPPLAEQNPDLNIYGAYKLLSGYNPRVAYSRETAPISFSPSEANFTVHAISLSLFYWAGAYYYQGGYIFLIDSGQEFTKDNLHTLTIDSFAMSW